MPENLWFCRRFSHESGRAGKAMKKPVNPEICTTTVSGEIAGLCLSKRYFFNTIYLLLMTWLKPPPPPPHPEKLEWKRKVKCLITKYWKKILSLKPGWNQYWGIWISRTIKQDVSISYGQVPNTISIVCIKPSFTPNSVWVHIFSRVIKRDLISSQSLNSDLCVAGKTSQWSTSFCGVAISR